MLLIRFASLMLTAGVLAAAHPIATLAPHLVKADPPPFADPDRRAKLAAASAAIDAIFTEFATQSRVPGGAWGIVIDGELAHAGATGYREIETKAPATADTVFRIASMTKSFTAMA